MTDELSRADLRMLMETSGEPCVSIYLPTHRAGAEIQQDPVRLKNLLRQAEDGLTAGGMRATEARDLLEPAHALLPERPFWQHQEEGLALFRSRALFRHYRLPLEFEELAVVSDRFHLKPLLPLLAGDRRFYILGLSRNEVRLLGASPYGAREIPLPPEVPGSMAEALKYDDPERQLQFHTRAAPRGGERAAMFHGHGVGVDDQNANLLRYFRLVDAGLHALLREEQAPLVLAGVEYLFPIYQDANTYPHLHPEGIPGNPDDVRPEELHAQAWRLLEPQFSLAQADAADLYRQLAGTERASHDLEEIVPAAANGRVDRLFVALGVHQWGNFDPDTQAVRLHDTPAPGDEDLLDRAAIDAFLNGGAVYAVPPEAVPADAPLAAVFRY